MTTETTSKWIIRDWMGNDTNLQGKTEFDSFGDARAAIDEFADEITGAGLPLETIGGVSNETKEIRMNGICEDLYAVNIDENGNELPDVGQYTV